MKEYLGGVISLFSKVIDHQVCYLAFSWHAGKLYDEYKLNVVYKMQQYNNEFIGVASVCFIADLSVIGISVNLLISAPLFLMTFFFCKINIKNVIRFVQRGFIFASNFSTLQGCNSNCDQAMQLQL